MSNNYALEADKREGVGKGVARALRRGGRVPAVIYGDKKEPVLISLDSNTVNVQYRRGHLFTSLCDMNVTGDKHLVLARDVQLHPITDAVEHIDFLRVSAKTKIAVNIPVHFTGEDESKALQAGGILSVIRFEVEMNCSATAIPDAIEIDISAKKMGDTIKISDANLPSGVTPVISDRDFTIATIEAPKTAAQEEAEEAAAEEAAAAAESEAEDAAAEEGDAE
jgi:large subunit ribosomal protein L25